MKPVKSFESIAKWLLRSSILLFVVTKYWDVIKQLSFKNLESILVFVFLIFGVLLFIGGFRKNSGITVLSGLLVFLISTYFIIVGFNGIFDRNLLTFIFPASVGLYFMSKGNH